MPRAVGTSLGRGAAMRVWKRTKHRGRGGGPLPSNPLSRNPWLWDWMAVVGLGEAPGFVLVLGHHPREHDVP